MKRFDRNVMFLGALAFVLVAAMLVLAFAISSPVEAGGGGGYCNPLYLRLGGCEPKVTCDIGTPQIQQDADGRYYLQCYYPPTRPESSGPLTLLEPGQRTKIGCPEPVVIYAIPDGESWLVVGCHD